MYKMRPTSVVMMVAAQRCTHIYLNVPYSHTRGQDKSKQYITSYDAHLHGFEAVVRQLITTIAVAVL